MKKYRGYPERLKRGGFTVQVFENDSRIGKELSPDPSLKLINHSPDGFCWGYGGSGPAQLAMALLLDVFGDGELALALHQQFKWDIVAKWDQDGSWEYTEDQIKAWLEIQKETV